MKLNIGAGGTKIEGFKSLDIMGEVVPDIVADVRFWETGNNTISEIYQSHTLEHFWYADAVALLRKFHRWLLPDGIMWIAVPDFERICKYYCAGDFSPYLVGLLFGNNRYPTDVHRHGWTRKGLRGELETIGFRIVNDNFAPWVRNANDTGWDASGMWYDDPSGERVGLSINFQCVKLKQRNT